MPPLPSSRTSRMVGVTSSPASCVMPLSTVDSSATSLPVLPFRARVGQNHGPPTRVKRPNRSPTIGPCGQLPRWSRCTCRHCYRLPHRLVPAGLRMDQRGDGALHLGHVPELLDDGDQPLRREGLHQHVVAALFGLVEALL